MLGPSDVESQRPAGAEGGLHRGDAALPSAAKKKKSAPEKTWHEDEFGVVTWGGYKEGETWHVEGHEPFARMLKILNASPAVPQSFKDTAIHVHDDLEVARSIAVSLFGKHWREHVMDVYDRMQARVPVTPEDE